MSLPRLWDLPTPRSGLQRSRTLAALLHVQLPLLSLRSISPLVCGYINLSGLNVFWPFLQKAFSAEELVPSGYCKWVLEALLTRDSNKRARYSPCIRHSSFVLYPQVLPVTTFIVKPPVGQRPGSESGREGSSRFFRCRVSWCCALTNVLYPDGN